MTMGARIRQARIEAGLSQRQLAGDIMTRNMLSALEHDGANPSVATLKYLSERLCKPIGYFLGEEPPAFPEAEEMEQARMAYSAEDFEGCLKYVAPLTEPAFRGERKLLEGICLLALGRTALEQGKLPYCRALLERCEKAIEDGVYMKAELKRQWLILSALSANEREREKLAAQIPEDSEVLLLRAEAALAMGMVEKAGNLLDGAERQETPGWNYLRGEVYFRGNAYEQAAKCYHRAEGIFPGKTAQRLEICYREMGDFKMAYYYAKKSENGAISFDGGNHL